MEMCRVCLSTEKQMLPLDETFIYNYNLLTNLNIKLLDGMPQYSCQVCTDTVKCFVEFREKSITSEATLREIIYSAIKEENKTHVIEIDKKPSSYDKENSITIKCEIKEESDETVLDGFDVPFEDYDEDHKYMIVKKDKDDVKLKIKRKKPKIHKGKTSKLIEKITNEIEDTWFCGICPKTFEDKHQLNNHLESHKNDRQCHICREHMNSQSQLYAHRLVHIPMKQYKCHVCNKRYKACIYLEYHYRTMHIAEDEKKLFCSDCPVTCDTPKKLNNHRHRMHSSVKYVCDMCSKAFVCRTNLKSHIKFHSKNKAYVCDMCGFSCKQSSGLKDHKLRKHSSQTVYCKDCKRPFKDQMEHDKHKCQIKLIVCPMCGVQLTGSARLSKHMETHSNIQKYECTRCPAKYKTSGALKAHLDRHDGNRTKQCEYCPAKFYTRSVLIKHRRVHTGEKPYVCKICHKGFTGNYNLKVHMKVHGEYLVIKKNSEQEDLPNFIK